MKRANNEGSIYYDKRSKTWVAAVSCGYNPQTGRPIRRTRHSRTKSGAVMAIAELRRLYMADLAADGASMALIDYLRDYVNAFKKPCIKPHTMIVYSTILTAVAKCPLAGRKLATLKAMDIQSGLMAIASPHTRKRALIAIRGAMRQAVSDGIIQRDPTAGLKTPTMPVRKDFDTISPAQAGQLIKAAASPIMAISVKLMYFTGMRPEEMLGLDWANVDTKRKIIKIRQASTRSPGGAALDTTKTAGSIRDIDIPSSLAADLEKYRRWQLEYIMARRDRYEDNGLVITFNGKPMASGNYSYHFRKLAQMAGVAITPRGLRHTHATQLFAAGWNAKDVQKRLGHSSIKMTMDIYTHYIPERGEGIADYLETLYPQLR